ncbi:hypothetical protein COU61_02970 [Candidatus Pacearchaeota archaeon CG10_big_fil_rev_8_21_14_0_10_35_13]|nr:MAG: hypothetical protein COU61_02970 [Candidatus Pacearchaeota archaeon CG10_big_fil_rev_8_21_14_0_10_35_13]
MEISNLTKNRIKEYLNKGTRFDGRELTEFRDISIETGISNKAEGSARVKIGKTEVLAGVKMSISEPYADGPEDGTMMVTVELLPLSSPNYELGPPKFKAIELGRITDRGIRHSGFIDFKKLCIEEGKKVWTIFIDIYSINDNGNLVDASAIAAVAALRDAKIPVINEETGRVKFGEWTEERLPLVMEKNPINITFSKIGNSIIIDPISEEEDSAESRVSVGLITYDKKVMISSIQNGEPTEFGIDELGKIFDKAEEMYLKLGKDVNNKIEEAIKRNNKK